MATSPLLRITGFTKTSNFAYFILTACVFSIFCLAHVKFTIFWKFPRGTGEAYWYRDMAMRIAMRIHLYSVIPAGILLPLQFVPIMRRKFITLHKYSGRLLFVLLIIANITALKVGPHSAGGTVDTQSAIVVLALASTIAIYKSWSGIRNLRIDQHRKWVIRLWAWVGGILSLRIMMYPLIVGIMIFSPGKYHFAKSCAEIIFLYPEATTNATTIANMYERFPTCANLAPGVAENTFVAVMASVADKMEKPEQMAAIFNLTFGVAFWLGFVVNCSVCEIYLNLTREEDERLKKFSLLRRRAAGLEKEGKGE